MKMWLAVHAELSSHPVGDPIKPNLKRTRELHALPCCEWSQQLTNGHWSLGLSVCLGLDGRVFRFFFPITSLGFIVQAINSVACSCESTNLKSILFYIFEKLQLCIWYIFVFFSKNLQKFLSAYFSSFLIFWTFLSIRLSFFGPSFYSPFSSFSFLSLLLLEQQKPSEQRGFTQ